MGRIGLTGRRDSNPPRPCIAIRVVTRVRGRLYYRGSFISPRREAISSREGKMTEMIEILRQEHRNIESLLRVLERELSAFDRGERPDYEVVLAVIDYFEDYPDTCHHPKEDMIVEKLRARDPVAAATIGDLEAEHQAGTKRLRGGAQAVGAAVSGSGSVRERVANIHRDFLEDR